MLTEEPNCYLTITEMEMNKSLNLRQDLNKIIGKRLRELRPIIASEEIEIMHLSSAAVLS